MKATSHPTVFAIFVAFGLAGCAAREAVVEWEPERYAAAARVVADDAANGEGNAEQALFEAGLAHALPHSPVYDPALARERFDRLLERYPRTRHRTMVLYLLPLLEEAEQQEERASARARDVESLRLELEEVKDRVERLEQLHEQQVLRASANRQLVETLQNELRERNARIRALEAQLEALMQIDLNPST